MINSPSNKPDPVRARGFGVVLFVWLIVTGVALVAGDAPADRPAGRPAGAPPEWRPMYRGIDHASAVVDTPRPLHVHAVRVRLRDPSIAFFVTPSNGDRPLETDGMKTSSFLKKYRCQVAINASPFKPFAHEEGDAQDVVGLSTSRGDHYSLPHPGYGALLISRENRAWIATQPCDVKEAHHAVGGFRLLLAKGKNVGTAGKLHPRTAVGVSKDGTFLYLLIVDGRQKGVSEGASTAETAEWMRWCGAHDALNLDGGGSTTLVRSDGRDGAKLLNRPIHGGRPGAERINANHLGVRAKPLKAANREPPAEGE